MEVLFPTIFLVLLGFVLLLNVITLPANWIMLGLIGLWRFAYPSPGDMGVFFFAMLVGLALFGEVIEYIAQGWGSKKYGSSTSGMWAGLLGALVGALAGLPRCLALARSSALSWARGSAVISWSATRGATTTKPVRPPKARWWADSSASWSNAVSVPSCSASPPRYFSGAGVS